MKACNIALKEWSVACRALEEGRQILLLRKGGLLDAEGAFELEYSHFWLMPTKWHQEANLLKLEHHDLLRSDSPPAREVFRLSSWAQAERVWTLDARDPQAIVKLGRWPHIWSTRYLDVRLGYQPEKPVVIVALRVHILPEPHEIEARPEYFGCKSWVELNQSLSLQPSRPVLDDEEFARRLDEISC